MAELENSKVVKNVLVNLINISGRKTSKGHALNTINFLLKKLENKYDFLRNVKIIDNRYIEDEAAVDVRSEINKINPDNMGKALSDIITTMHYNLGDKAGHFFIKELQRNIGGDYNEVIKEMGVDLGLMQLEKEIGDISKTILHKK